MSVYIPTEKIVVVVENETEPKLSDTVVSMGAFFEDTRIMRLNRGSPVLSGAFYIDMSHDLDYLVSSRGGCHSIYRLSEWGTRS